MLCIAEAVRPKLIRDGMFLVGLDLVGDKLMEINVFTPGGITSCTNFTGIDFADLIVAELERKVAQKPPSGGTATNAELATL